MKQNLQLPVNLLKKVKQSGQERQLGRTVRNQSNRASKVLRKGKHVGEMENYERIELSILCGLPLVGVFNVESYISL